MSGQDLSLGLVCGQEKGLQGRRGTECEAAHVLCSGWNQVAVWVSACCLTSLCLRFLICKVVMQVVPSSQSSYRDELVTL